MQLWHLEQICSQYPLNSKLLGCTFCRLLSVAPVCYVKLQRQVTTHIGACVLFAVTQWNEALLQLVVAPAYLDLLGAAAKLLGHNQQYAR
jgi:hypothetical protein